MMIATKQGKFGLCAGAVEIGLLIIYGFLTRYDPSADAKYNSVSRNSTEPESYAPLTSEFGTMYAMFQDIHVMIFIGFGFLMTFLKKYGYSAVGLNLFLAALAIQIYIIVSGFFNMQNGLNYIPVNLVSMINADFAAAAILISFGAVLGKTSPLQLLVMVVIEVIAYCLNNWINSTYLQGADVGGSMVIHIFGAYFGLAVAFVLRRSDLDNGKEGSVYHSDLFSMIGTVFLWIFWPSFNGATAVADDQHRAVINTYLSLVCSCIVTFIVSNCVASADHRFDMVHVQNATLAGGVAVGTAADTMLQPWGACLVGAAAGLLSTLGYRYIQPFLLSTTGLHDTCGVNNLHGMPGILAGIIGIIMLATANEAAYGLSLYVQFPQLSPKASSHLYQQLRSQDPNLEPGLGRTAVEQAGYQAAALLTALGIAIVSGTITGYVMKMPCLDTIEGSDLFDDVTYWQVPDEPEELQILPVPAPPDIWNSKVAPATIEERITNHLSRPTTTRLTNA